ncbi:MAG: hypothetical protein OXI64_06335, partial [Defluviicoccus sp.]|nr:hypothetical protein [Defluviicoccus sp.]
MAKNLATWDPEDEAFWEADGKRIATRNLWISIPCLLCGFAVWLYWGIITVQMINLKFPFSQAELFTLAAIAGLSGATLRIPSSFFIRMAGGRNTIFLTTTLLIIPAAGTGWLLQDPTTPLWQFQAMALLSGFGGGNFASSMSNISFFYPKKVQGLSLGMNAGLGNFGVTTMQILVPLVMTVGIFGGSALVLANSSGTLVGKIPAGTETYIHNAGYVWVAILVPLAVAAWFGMNNITASHVSPGLTSTAEAFGKILGMLGIGLVTAAIGLWLLLPAKAGGSGLELSKWLVLPLVIATTVFALRAIPGTIRQSLDQQYAIFRNKHTWAMTVIYTMTFGSFIGYAAAFGLAIKVVFGFQHIEVDGVMTHTTVNPNGPSALMYAWTGPFIGALIRPIGGMISDRLGGALVTQIVSVIMVVCALGVAYFLSLAYASPTPEDYFVPFLLLFLVLFAATGIGNGSTFRTIAI